MTMRLTFTLISAVISSFQRVRRIVESDPRPRKPLVFEPIGASARQGPDRVTCRVGETGLDETYHFINLECFQEGIDDTRVG